MKRFITLIICLILSSPALAQAYTVERVIDGDTLKLTNGEEGSVDWYQSSQRWENGITLKEDNTMKGKYLIISESVGKGPKSVVERNNNQKILQIY